jgi:hypothetical protein
MCVHMSWMHGTHHDSGIALALALAMAVWDDRVTPTPLCEVHSSNGHWQDMRAREHNPDKQGSQTGFAKGAVDNTQLRGSLSCCASFACGAVTQPDLLPLPQP